MERLLKTGEVAEYLGVTTTKVYQWVRSGELPRYRLGSGERAEYRFSETQIKDWLEQSRETK